MEATDEVFRENLINVKKLVILPSFRDNKI